MTTHHTLETLKDKSPEELNVICAELCGWARSEQWDYSLYGRISRNPNQHAVNRVPAYEKDGNTRRAEELPAYATSYDAIIGEIHKLTDAQFYSLKSHLSRLTWLRDERAQTYPSPADLTRALILVKQDK